MTAARLPAGVRGSVWDDDDWRQSIRARLLARRVVFVSGTLDDRAASQAADPSLRTVAIIEWIETRYGVHDAPNTRETIRRQTMHQFIEAALVVEIPDLWT